MIYYMLWNMKKKSAIFFSPIMTRPPPSPLVEHQNWKTLVLKTLKKNTGSWYYTKSFSLHVDYQIEMSQKTSLKGGLGTPSLVKDHTISGFSYEGFL